MDIANDPKAELESPKRDFPGGYGYMWADWLFGREKDKFMVDVYNACHIIDECTDPSVKATKLILLREKVRACKKAWLEGVDDFIEFEIQLLARGRAPIEILGDGDDYGVLGALHASYLHGAFRGLCRNSGGAEWIEELSELCAVAVHQGFKWLRSRHVSDWELPSFGEAWSKGIVMWGIVCMYMAVDVAGDDAANDPALERMHTLIAAHHFAGANWMHYRDAHPHKWWQASARGRAPSEDAIRRFGESRGWAKDTVSILVKSAKHVNSWTNPAFGQAHFQRTRGLLIWDHTPRLKARIDRVSEELCEVAGAMSESEAQECTSRISVWLATHSTHWRGRGDDCDLLNEISCVGAIAGVLRESRPHLTDEFVERVVAWCRPRAAHLSPCLQDLLLDKVRHMLEVRGRVPGAVSGYASAGTGSARYVDGVWEMSTWCIILGSPDGGKEVPVGLRELVVRYFNTWQRKRIVAGKDFAPGSEVSTDCQVCIGDALFKQLVDNRPSKGVLHCMVWGALLYQDLGLGEPEAMSL